ARGRAVKDPYPASRPSPIPLQYVDRLRRAGLLVSEARPFPPPTGAGVEGAVEVAKPRAAGGNGIPGFEVGWGSKEVIVDAPWIFLYPSQDGWAVTAYADVWVPGPSPAEFSRVFGTLDAAAEDILDYYFGDPSRTQHLRQEAAEKQRRELQT